MKKEIFFARLIARFVDSLFVSVLANSINLIFSMQLVHAVSLMFFYSILTALFHGLTLGKFSFGLHIEQKSAFKLIYRETIFFLFLPVIIIQVLFLKEILFHDKLSKSKVVFLQKDTQIEFDGFA